MTISGANAADFSVVAQPTPLTLQPPGSPHAAPAPRLAPQSGPLTAHHHLAHLQHTHHGKGVTSAPATPTPTPSPTPITSTTFQVKYHPSGTGASNATLTVNSDDPNTPAYSFAVGGTGISSGVASVSGNGANIASGDTNTVAADFTSFGTLDANATVTKTFAVANLGSARWA